VSSIFVVADDLTGANATAAGFARAGLRAVTVGAGQDPAGFAARFDVVVVSTDGRHCPPREAAGRIDALVRAGWPASLVCNRIDSTLRGNVGASTAAVLRAVRELSGRRAVALCAPAHPAAGRQTVEGHQLLDGIRLEETELAVDPRAPVATSDVGARLTAQADLRVGHLPLSAVTGDPAELAGLVRTILADEVDVVVADALTAGHLDRVAAAAVAAAGTEITLVGVDSGPGSVALAGALGLTGRATGAPLLAVSGSATQLTRTQLARLRAEHPVTVVPVVPVAGGVVPDVAATADALDRAMAAADAGDVVLLATVLADGDVVPIGGRDAERLPIELARAVRRVLERHPVDGLFATGGDVSAALFAELEAGGVDVADEIVPLAVAGTFVSGPWAGLPVATKGGLVGDAGTTVVCLEYLRRMADATRRHVRSIQSRKAYQEER
jgi:uncharacterized protein YgbK (DUF1537 family)